MQRIAKIRTAVAALVCVAAALSLPGQQDEPMPGPPLPGLTLQEYELFRTGLLDFMEVETPEDGLGPAFNGSSCAQCHNIPRIGGAGTMLEVRAGVVDESGKFHAPPGGTLMHLFSNPPHTCQVSIYPEANVIAHRISIPLFGAGLIEAIADETLLALADPEDRDGDGVRGRAAIIEDVASGQKRVGRFGWKAQQATLLAFAGDAYRNEMGITNDLFPGEASAGDPQRMRECDPSPDPEDFRDRLTGLRGVDNFENFMKFLAPPPRGRITAEVSRGESIFADLGCPACHVPQLETGPNRNPLFDRKPVHLYSDLLLHDVGTGDGIEQGAALANEIRTPALWGLRFRRPLLHDGSAPTIEHAIRRHQGEAGRSAERFQALSPDLRKDLLAFLNAL